MDESTRTDQGQIHCIRCGYNLRGVAVDGACPECGEPVTESAITTRCITKREVAQLACRILAVIFIVRFALTLASVALSLVTAWLDNNPNVSGQIEWILPAMVYICMYGALCWLLWFPAPWIARAMVSEDGPAMPRQQWTARDLMNVAVCVLGLYLAATGLQIVVGAFLGQRPGYYGVEAGFGPGAVRCIIGLMLIAGRQRLARMWHRARTAGTSQG